MAGEVATDAEIARRAARNRANRGALARPPDNSHQGSWCPRRSGSRRHQLDFDEDQVLVAAVEDVVLDAGRRNTRHPARDRRTAPRLLPRFRMRPGLPGRRCNRIHDDEAGMRPGRQAMTGDACTVIVVGDRSLRAWGPRYGIATVVQLKECYHSVVGRAEARGIRRTPNRTTINQVVLG